MSASEPQAGTTVSARWSRWRGVAVGLLLLSVCGVGGYLYWRSSAFILPLPIEVAYDDMETEVAEAIRKARQTLLQQLSSATAWGEYGHVLGVHGFTAEALTCYVQAERLNPTDPRWPYWQGVLKQRTDPEAAIRHLERACQLGHPDPTTAGAMWLRLIDSRLHLGQLEAAEQAAQEALRLDPNHVKAQLQLGILRLQQNRPKEALTYLESIVQSPYCRKQAALQLANAYLQLGEEALALHYQTLSREAPEDADWPDPFMRAALRFQVGTQARLAEAEKLLAAGRASAAIELLRQNVQVNPTADTWLVLGRVLSQTGQHDEADAALREALRLDPTSVQGHYFAGINGFFQAEKLGSARGQAEKRRLLLEQARLSLQRTVERKPDHGIAWMYLGLCQRALGQPQETWASLRRAVQCRPDVAETHRHWGEQCLALGHRDLARQALEEARRLRPQDAEIQRLWEQATATSPEKNGIELISPRKSND